MDSEQIKLIELEIELLKKIILRANGEGALVAIEIKKLVILLITFFLVEAEKNQSGIDCPPIEVAIGSMCGFITKNLEPIILDAWHELKKIDE